MSIAIMSRLFKMSLGSCNRKLLALRLADFADDEGRGIWPTVARLSQETELSERTVQRTLKEFVDEGLLVVVANASGRPGQATRYDFDLAALERFASSRKEQQATGDNVTPVDHFETGDTAAETGDKSDIDGCHGDTRTIIEPLQEPSERESVREGLEGKAAAEPSESREAIERAFMRFFPKWPTYIADSQPAARKAWFALSPGERIEATERMAAYLAADKAAGRKYHCSAGAYLAEKRWLKLPEPLKEPERPKMAAPFGKAWSALRLRELLKQMAPMPKLPSVSQYLVDQGGEKADLILRDHRERHGWPKVTDMHEKAKAFSGVTVSPDLIAASQDFQPVKVGSDLEAAWRRLHQRWQWPWMPDPGRQEWLYFPAIDPDEADLDKAVAGAVFEFKARIGDHVHAAAE